MTGRFTQKAQNALNAALNAARSLGHTYIGSEHLLLGISSDRDNAASRLLAARGAVRNTLRSAVISISGKGSESLVGASDMTPCVKRIIEEAASLSAQFGQSYVGTEHILLALLGESDCVGIRVLEACSVSPQELKNDITSFLGGAAAKGKNRAKADKGDLKQLSAFSGYGKDLTAAARLGRLDPVVGRDTETMRVIQILSRRQKNNPCLVGEPGVGKTAVVEGLAQRIAEGSVPEPLRDRAVIMLDLPSMIAGAKYRGEFEERMKNVMNEIAKRPEVILFIDELHMIVGAGAAEGSVDAANILKPALSRGEIRIIGATTLTEYRRYIEKDAALERRFQPVNVSEPSPEETVMILKGLRDRLEAHHGLKLPDTAIRTAVDLSVRYINERFLPDKAIDLIDETASRLRVSGLTEPPELRQTADELTRLSNEKDEAITHQDFELAARIRDLETSLFGEYEKKRRQWIGSDDLGEREVSSADIAETVAQMTGIPIGRMTEDENEGLLRLEERLDRLVVGQKDATERVARAIRRGRTGLSDPDRPVGTFIFLGPTGVGKTALSEALAETVFGSKKSLIRLDMSEYMEKHSVSKMIGSPPGYVGYAEGGILTEKVRRNPYSLVLFDEIEKAHPDIFNILLQILDGGRLTDSQGRVTDFRNTVVIMTSNLGSDRRFSKALGFEKRNDDPAANESRILSALKNAFPPEFINRIDDIVIFRPLAKEDLYNIADKMLCELAGRAKAYDIDLSFDSSVARLVVDNTYEPEYGARPLRRSVTRLVGDAFSVALLKKEFAAGDSVTAVSDGGKIIFVKNGDKVSEDPDA